MSRRIQNPLLLGGVLTMFLAACGQTPTGSPTSPDPYANGADYPWEYTAPAGGLTALGLTPGENNLYFEPILAAQNGWGPIEVDRSNGEQLAGDGGTLTLNGKTYSRGFGTHAGSELRYSLKGTNGAKCFNFTADVGVDDEVGNMGSVVFQVFTDGVKVYDSGRMTGASATKRVNVSVVGKQELRLVVTDAGDGKRADHADWAIPRVSCATQNPTPGSVDTSWGALPGFPASDSSSPRKALLAPDNSVLLGNIFARQTDGKRLVVTNAAGTDGKFGIRRYNLDGSLDTSYGQAGQVTMDFGSGAGRNPDIIEDYGAHDAVLQPDGKLIVVGQGWGPKGDADFALARYNPNGSLDPSFGQGGLVLTDLAPLAGNPDPSFFYTDEIAKRVRLGPNGTIVVLGPYYNYYGPRPAGALVRYQADGSLDTSFAGIGMRQIIGDITDNYARSFVVEGNGDVVYDATVGRASTYVGVRVARIYADGSYGGETPNFFLGAQQSHFNVIRDLTLQQDGKIVVGGASDPGEGASDGVLVRLNPDLTFDTRFGSAGNGQVILNTLDGGVQRVLIQPDGKIVAVGSSILRVWP